MTAKEWWMFIRKLRPTWQFVALTVVIGIFSRTGLAIWFGVWVLFIIGAGLFDPRIKHTVQVELLKERIEREERGAPPEK